jgi:hypothetical protein
LLLGRDFTPPGSSHFFVALPRFALLERKALLATLPVKGRDE